MSQYPDFLTATRYGYADGLKGVNCRHDYFYIDEHSTPAYTDQQLTDFESAETALHDYNGKKFNLRGIADEMRRMERIMRKTRQSIAMQKEALTALPESEAEAREGMESSIAGERNRYRSQITEYKRFADHFKHLGFYDERSSRVIIDGLGRLA
jgi:hypothetical protein